MPTNLASFSNANAHVADDYLRFVACKSDAELELARRRLEGLKSFISVPPKGVLWFPKPKVSIPMLTRGPRLGDSRKVTTTGISGMVEMKGNPASLCSFSPSSASYSEV